MKAALVGIAGTVLAPAEAALFRALPPAGIILFARNVADPAQLQALTASLRALLPPQALIAVDQEGGRVARLRPPHWHRHPAAGALGALFRHDPQAGTRAARLTGLAIGRECRTAGFDMVCAPVLDLAVPGQSDIVGDRAFGADPAQVSHLATAFADGLMTAGIIPVGKHVPGHGRAVVDSHHELPVVPASAPLDLDQAAFTLGPPMPCLMTAHIVYQAFDRERPATLSPLVLGEIVRRTIGFQGLLISDDLAMKALSGEPGALAAASIAAGCDLALYCPGDPAGTESVLRQTPPVEPRTRARIAAARDQVRAAMQDTTENTPRDVADIVAERDVADIVAERDGLLLPC